MKFTLTLDSENAASQNPKDLVEILEEQVSHIRKRVMQGYLDEAYEEKVFDPNGNSIGEWKYEPSPIEECVECGNEIEDEDDHEEWCSCYPNDVANDNDEGE